MYNLPTLIPPSDKYVSVFTIVIQNIYYQYLRLRCYDMFITHSNICIVQEIYNFINELRALSVIVLSYLQVQ